MNLPNKITIARLAATPFFAASLICYGNTGSIGYYIGALVIFTLAAVSDGVDGYLARSRNQQTRLGTILDPLADKVLFNTTIIILSIGVGNFYRIPVWLVLIVICRDLLLVTISICLYRRWSEGSIQVRPNWMGKTSAVLLMGTVIWIILHPDQPPPVITGIGIYLTALFTVLSGITYLTSTIKELNLLKQHTEGINNGK
jgi:cardiolipin synthase (CMP-forming)